MAAGLQSILNLMILSTKSSARLLALITGNHILHNLHNVPPPHRWAGKSPIPPIHQTDANSTIAIIHPAPILDHILQTVDPTIFAKYGIGNPTTLFDLKPNRIKEKSK